MSTNSSAPKCPTEVELAKQTAYIEDLKYTPDTSQNLVEMLDGILNSLRFLDNFLQNRRGYQRKSQIKRKMVFKVANELGLMQEIDDAVAAKFGHQTIDQMTDEEIEQSTQEDDE